MKSKLSLLLLTALTLPTAFSQESADAAVINAVVTSLYEEDKILCYHFTDEVPPEEYISLPECTLTPEKFSGALEVGAFFNTGDNNSALAKTRADLVHEIGKMRNNYLLDFYARKSEQEEENGDKIYVTTDQKWSTALQSNYVLEDGGKNYVFGFLGYEDDRFNGFDYQSSLAAGWGRRWLETNTSYFDAEIGPGLKVDAIKETDTISAETQKAVIIRAATTYEQNLFDSIQFKQTFSVEMAPKSGENSKFKSISSVTTKLIESLALKFSFYVDHNTEVEGDADNTRTETSLTLVYSI
ncbi:YdiY family protein [Thalassotalea aquiviva]|uniref:DUF481 domain-containing protein n=1 Tax=Thalassotalea aquiviva TaxID=3242415 RepID=UPI00352AD436